MPDTLDPARLEAARRRLLRRDPRLGRVIRRVGACQLRPAGDPYRSLLRSVLHQQLAGAAARAIEARLRAPHARPLPGPRGAGGGRRRRAAGGRPLAPEERDRARGGGRLRRGTPRRAPPAPHERRRGDRGGDRDPRHRGVDRAHAADRLLRETRRAYRSATTACARGRSACTGSRELPKRAELEALAEPWRPYRSVAAWYLWRVMDDA